MNDRLGHPTHRGSAHRPGSTVRAEVARYTKHAEELPQILIDRGNVANIHLAWDYLVLRSVGGMQLDEVTPPVEDRHPTWEPNLVPGLLVEGARYLEHDGFDSIEITVWAGGEMQLIVTQPLVELVLLTVHLPEGEI